uniref:Ig-like domain-containing protein n=1 Tax=Sinocyclocheilus grahami TaxID=75366 RepID=A0A672LDL0_SINGR
MADTCHLCLLGLIFLSSLLTGSSGVDDAHVFISSGQNVHLSCNNALPDCTSTTWNYNRFNQSETVELIGLGITKTDTEKHERLSLGSDCSLNIKNVTKEDYGLYTCRQYVNDKQLGTDARVYLHVFHVSSSSSSSQTEISAGRSVTLSCQLYSFADVSCDDLINSEGIQLFWVNQAGDNLINSDSRYQILFSSDHCISTLNTTLLNEDHNRECRCNVTHRDQVKASVTYTVKSSVIVIIVEFAVFAAPTVILLQIICARRTGEFFSLTQSATIFKIAQT